ncbi:MAG: hypothetical protein ISN29_03045, partial [Gammaproteobacteria bacterium AqS3]|nr:hypothetical protein [Gammaproteobacteria bacterium AqS3]
VKRYRLTFSSKADYRVAAKKCEDIGYLRFRPGGGHDLIGMPVRMSAERWIIEVDAAADLDALGKG